MKFKVGQALTGLDGEKIALKAQGISEEGWLTIAKLIVQALLAIFEHKPMSGEEKFKRYTLANKIYGKEVVDLSLEELNLIKTAAGDVLNPYQAGKVWEFLEAPLPEDKKIKAVKS